MLRTSMKLAVAVLAAGVVVSACGPVKMGAAAIVGNERISTATLSAEAANLSAAYHAAKGHTQIPYPAAQIPQQALSWLLRFKIREEQAAHAGIHVTTGDAQRALAVLAAQLHQSDSTIREAAVANGLPPDLIPELGRYLAIGNALTSRADGGTTPTTTAAQQALAAQLNRDQCLASKGLAIQVNPQFGALDYNQLTVVPAKSGVSATQPPVRPSPSASASAAPRLTPPC